MSAYMIRLPLHTTTFLALAATPRMPMRIFISLASRCLRTVYRVPACYKQISRLNPTSTEAIQPICNF